MSTVGFPGCFLCALCAHPLETQPNGQIRFLRVLTTSLRKNDAERRSYAYFSFPAYYSCPGGLKPRRWAFSTKPAAGEPARIPAYLRIFRDADRSAASLRNDS